MRKGASLYRMVLTHTQGGKLEVEKRHFKTIIAKTENCSGQNHRGDTTIRVPHVAFQPERVTIIEAQGYIRQIQTGK